MYFLQKVLAMFQFGGFGSSATFEVTKGSGKKEATCIALDRITFLEKCELSQFGKLYEEMYAALRIGYLVISLSVCRQQSSQNVQNMSVGNIKYRYMYGIPNGNENM